MKRDERAAPKANHTEDPVDGDGAGIAPPARREVISPYVSLRDDLAAQSQSDAVRHGIVRARFVSLLLDDERVVLLFEEWLRHCGCAEVMLEARRLFAEVVARSGASTAAEFVARVSGNPNPFLRCEGADDLEAVKVTLARLSYLFGRVEALMVAAAASTYQQARAFVIDLGLPWPWLAVELLDAFETDTKDFVFGVRTIKTITAVTTPASVEPEVSFAFRNAPGESREEIVRRFQAEVAVFTARLQRLTGVERGRIPKDTTTLHQYAEWFYRNRIRHESPRQIARTSFPRDLPENRRSHVQRGIREADRLLGLTPYHF